MSTYVVVYETPAFGSHHFSPIFRSSSQELKTTIKKPKWVTELQQNALQNDLDTVILMINCAAAAKMFFDRHLVHKTSSFQYPKLCMLVSSTCQLVAICVASFSTLFFIILQLLFTFISYASQSWIYFTLEKVFGHTWKNMRVRCCQILYWPVFLQHNGFRSPSSVEYAEKVAVHRHSLWSSVAVDVLLGNLIGLTLLFHKECVCSWVTNLSSNVTNNLLRSGCVWLMGAPAGFKLNVELAGLLGMISLNAIQIWSTLWFFVGFLLEYYIKGLATLGIIFGATVPAALIIDTIALATLHISTLHWFISLLYSHQIHALAALWRLFRGRKWNPLRQRLDSYDYTVAQHVVGSLLFTPLLLLLPTTLVFYIFLTIMNTTIIFICMLIEIAISVIHATPYVKIILWLVRPKRFPSGVWFEIISCQNSGNGLAPETSYHMKEKSETPSSVLVSYLHSNLLKIGQLVLPDYRTVFCGVSGSYIASLAYGVLSGRRTPSSLRTGLPPQLPWMTIPYKLYWSICHDSVLSWMDCNCDAVL